MEPARSPVEAVQTAVYDRLRLDNELEALGVTVGEDLAESQPKPYVQLGDFLSVPSNDHGGFGRILTGSLHTWTGEASNLPGLRITDRIAALLDEQSLDLEGHGLVYCKFSFDQILRDPDAALRHHVQRFRFRTSQQPT